MYCDINVIFQWHYLQSTTFNPSRLRWENKWFRESANLGLFCKDFTNPKLNLRGVHLVIFRNRCFSSRTCAEFYQVLHNSIVENVLIVQPARSPIRTAFYSQSLLDTFFFVEKGPMFTFEQTSSIRGRDFRRKEEVQLLKLTKRKVPNHQSQHTLDAPLIAEALELFTSDKADETYRKTVDDCIKFNNVREPSCRYHTLKQS